MLDRTHALGLWERSVPLCLFGTQQSGTLVSAYRRGGETYRRVGVVEMRIGEGLNQFLASVDGPTRRYASAPRRHADTPGFVAPKWARDFSLGRSPRNIKKSDQALKALQKKLRAAIYRGKELVPAFFRPDRAGGILHAFPGASPQAFVFWPFQGARSPIRRYASAPRRHADTPIRFQIGRAHV